MRVLWRAFICLFLMKRLLPLFFFLYIVLVRSCTEAKKDDSFIVQGTTSQNRLNGKKIFLVPWGSKEIEDSIGVDSVWIKDNKFEFQGHGEYIARVSVERRERYSTQDLLIVTEHGSVINVVIDSVSYGGGTPQNEVLQQWKELKEAHDLVAGPHVVRLHYLRKNPADSLQANVLADSLREFNEHFRQQVLDITKLIKEGPAYDLLMSRYGN